MGMVNAVGRCQALITRSYWVCYVAAVSLTSLLFFFRVRALFWDNKWIVAFFSILWLCTVAGSILAIFSVFEEGTNRTMHYCIIYGSPFSSSAVVILAVNDTLVFFSISWKLLSASAVDESFKAKLKIFISGHGLPAFSRSLLQSGQEYYLYVSHVMSCHHLSQCRNTKNSVTVAWNILTIATILGPSSLPNIYRLMFIPPNVAIGNSMACHVYCDIKFGRISSTHTTM
jgi:hypothetical protein